MTTPTQRSLADLFTEIEALSAPAIDLDVLRAIIAQRDTEIARLSSRLQLLQEQLNLLTARRFGPSSEKVHPDQCRLFNEAELEVVAHLRGRRPSDDRDPGTSTASRRP